MRDGRIDLGPGIKRVLILPGLGVTLWPESVESALSEIDLWSELVLLSSSSRRWAFNYLKAQLHITLSDALLDQETLATLTVPPIDRKRYLVT